MPPAGTMAIYEDDLPLLAGPAPAHLLLPRSPSASPFHASKKTSSLSLSCHPFFATPTSPIMKCPTTSLTQRNPVRRFRERFGLSKVNGDLKEACNAVADRSSRNCTVTAYKPGKTDFIMCSVRAGPPREIDIEGAKVCEVSQGRISYKVKKSRAYVIHLY